MTWSLPTVTIAVLNYNRSAEVIETLDMLLEVDYPDELIRLVVIDNDSNDGSVELIEENFGQRVNVLRHRPNIGPVVRNRALLRSKTDYVFMFDDDCQPSDASTIRKTVAFLEQNREYGALCFACINRETGEREFNHPGNAFRSVSADGTYEGIYVIGGGMAFRTESISGLEGYDERLHFGGEEYDLALELMRAGVPIAFRSDLAILHREAPRAERAQRAWELDMRNNIRISFRRFPLILAPAIALTHALRRLTAALAGRDRRRLTGYLRGIRSGCAGLLPFLLTRRPVPFHRLLKHRFWFLQMFLGRPLFRRRTGDNPIRRG